MLDTTLDLFRIRQYFNAITMARELLAGIRNDATFLDVARRAVLPLPFERRRGPARSPFPPLHVASAPHFEGRRVAIVASGGSGALACVIGVARAFEELGIRPSAYSLCSGSALFGFPLATGRSPDEVAQFVLSLQPHEYVDVDWMGLATLVPRLARGFTGIVRGDAIERAYRRWLRDMTLGELRIPAYAPVWNADRNRLEYIGTRSHPEIPVALAVRMAIALPLFIKAVRYRGAHYGDGGVVDILPVGPVLDIEPRPDAAVVVNALYPPNFEGEDITGWADRIGSILYAASQVRSCQHIQLGRHSLARLQREVGEVISVDPVPYSVVSGVGVYREFLETTRWRDFMLAGRREALHALRRAEAVPRRPAGPRWRRRPGAATSRSRQGPAGTAGAESAAGGGAR